MIHALTGRITGKQEGMLLLSCGSVEWSILCSNATLAALPAPGSTCTVYTHLHHREDQMFLTGFSDQLERKLFLDLISVSGIGPKQGLRILSGLPSQLLVNAIKQDDVATLSKVPGMGKKTAQKVILALKGNLVELEEREDPSRHADIVEALIQMGYERQQVKKALQEITSRDELSGMEEGDREAYLMKEAIRLMS